jgi:serine/threonine-protein kinase
MLDSIAAAPGAAPPSAPADSAASTKTAAAATVPTMVDLDEGAARAAIVAAGLQVGEVRFAASTKTAGTVLATDPGAGTVVNAGTSVVLILSDGRAPVDTGNAAPASPSSAPRRLSQP